MLDNNEIFFHFPGVLIGTKWVLFVLENHGAASSQAARLLGRETVVQVDYLQNSTAEYALTLV